MRKYLHLIEHLFFIVAIGTIVIGVEEATYSIFRWDDFAPYLAIAFIILFFLWKRKYFTQSK